MAVKQIHEKIHQDDLGHIEGVCYVLQDEQELARGCRKAERGGEKEERKGENIKSAKT